MDESQTYLSGTQTIRNILYDTFGNLFNAYFIGTPDIIPEAAFPCIVIRKATSSHTVGPTMTDDVQENILIHVLLNGKIGWGTPDDDDTVERQLENLIEARIPGTGEPDPTTLLYALRQNITFTSTIIGNDAQVNYDVTPRIDQSTIYEAIITVTTQYRVFYTNRT